MIAHKTVTLIIPCRNEAVALTAMLKQVPKSIDEVIVVDNNSSDQTRQVARKFGAKVIREPRHVGGIGYGYAHQSGIQAATGEYIVTMDGDNTYPAKLIPQLLRQAIKQELDFVSCNRFPLQNTTAISRTRQLGVFILNTEVSILYLRPIKDILSGMWIAKTEVLRNLDLQCGGWNLSPEIKLAALMNPAVSFAEFHIPHHYRLNDESKQQIWKTGFDHVLYILWRRLTVDSPFAQRSSAVQPISTS